MSKKNYPLIDIMRIIASLLVIGIHTYPFLQINPSLDFFTTHILGRLGVPFFFITTSFFLFQKGLPTLKKLKSVLLQLLMIYSVSIVIYIPIQIYNHSLDLHPIVILKDIFIDGPFYHLWYLPAVILGICIVYILNRFLTIKQSFVIVACLYIIGLGGDSYYGLFNQIPFLKDLYTYLFQVCEYTRNGFFFAPLFIWLGSFIATQKHRISKKHWIPIFILSFLMMSLETSILHHYQIPRHDAMTILLPLTMYLFFMILLSYQGKRHPLCKDLSLYVYIIHPMMIVIVRLLGKILHLETYLIDHNLIHFLIVTVLSFLSSYLFIKIQKGVIHLGYSSTHD